MINNGFNRYEKILLCLLDYPYYDLKEIYDKLDIYPQDGCKIVKFLEEKELIIKHKDHYDKRKKYIKISDKGREVIILMKKANNLIEE